MKEDLRLETLEQSGDVALDSQAVQILRPLHLLDQGALILDEVRLQATEEEDEALVQWLADKSESHGEELLGFICIKFGLITTKGDDLFVRVLEAQAVAERILTQHRHNQEAFRQAFIDVMDEEVRAAESISYLDMREFEGKVFEELAHLVTLSRNPELEKILFFVDDLERIFQGQAFVFSYLEHRYGECFGTSSMTPQYLAVQIALDFLTHGEPYQLAVLDDYERILKRDLSDRDTKTPKTVSSNLQ